MVRGTEVAQKEGKAEQQMGGAEAEKGEEKGRAEEEAGVRVGREETEVGTERIEDTDLLFFFFLSLFFLHIEPEEKGKSHACLLHYLLSSDFCYACRVPLFK